MTVLWTSKDAAAATRGRLDGGDWAATGVSIDSRTVGAGDLFVAIRGPNFDGHRFVADALARGAVAALVSERPADVGSDARLLLVEGDTLGALEDLGSFARLRSAAGVVAVTGSVGKTGTKEALRTALSAQGETFATYGSFNNHWGVPLSLARLPQSCRFGVFELGMNHPGEITPLSRQVKPDVAIITTVEAVHLEFFPSVAAIADAKAEIFEGMEPTGTAVLPRDNPHFARLLAAARTKGLGRILTFGSGDDVDARLLDVTPEGDGSRVRADILGTRYDYSLPVPGRHWAINSLATILAVGALGADMEEAAAALRGLPAMKGRGARREIALPGGRLTLIDESYNASPVSVTAALGVLGQAPVGRGGRRIAVLGDMRELGEQAPELHAGLAAPFAQAGIDLLYACGPNMRRLFDQVPADRRGAWAETSAQLAPIVARDVRPGDVVSVKGSLGSRMADVVAALDALAPTDDSKPASSSAA